MKPIRITELSTMGTCEQKWYYRYAEEGEDESSAAMTLGSLLHAAATEWWAEPRGFYHVDWAKVLDHLDERAKAGLTEDIAATATWLCQRYDEVYQPSHGDWEVVADELELEAQLDGLLCQGRVDRILRHRPTDRLYLGETKSMKDWRRLDILAVDPQVTHYVALAKANGYPVDGVMYDAIKTYRWKTGKHPAEESFQRLYLDRTDEHIQAAMGQLHAFDDRRTDLTLGKRIPLRNISHMTCSWCSQKDKCWEALAFPEPDIEVV